MMSWNMLEINITNLILVICGANDSEALSAAINKLNAVHTRIEMLNSAIQNCNHLSKKKISEKWKKIRELLDDCQKQRNKLAHYCLLHSINEMHQVEPVLVENLFKFPRGKHQLNIVDIENARSKFFALGNQLENLNHFISGNSNTLPLEFEGINTVNSIDEVLYRHGYVSFHE